MTRKNLTFIIFQAILLATFYLPAEALADKPPRQVMIESKIVETNTTDTENSGVDFRGLGDSTGELRETGDSTGIFRETGDNTGIFRETGDSTGIFRETGDSTGIFRETGDSTGIFRETGDATGVFNRSLFFDKLSFKLGIPLDWAIETGGVKYKFNGKDQTTGNIGDLILTNYLNHPLNFFVPQGTTFYPYTEDVQRTTLTDLIRGSLQPGQSSSFSVKGACLDSQLFPPPAGLLTRYRIGTPFLRTNIFGSYLGAGGQSNFFRERVWDDFFDFVDEEIDFELYMRRITPELLDFLEISPQYFDEYILIPILEDILDDMYDEGMIPPTGLPASMEYNTILQWLIWEFTDDFDEEDGLLKITGQVRGTGGTQTDSQIGTLNTNLWSNIDLVKKEAKRSDLLLRVTPRIIIQEEIEMNKLRPIFRKRFQEKFQEKIIEEIARFVSFEKEAYAEAAETMEELQLAAANEIHRLKVAMFLAQNITFEIEKLVDSPYSKKIAKTKKKLADPIREKLNDIQEKVDASRPEFKEVRALTEDDFRFMRDRKGDIVKKDGDINDLWKEIKAQLDKTYPKWDEEYKKLVKRSKKSVTQGKDYLAFMTRDQRKFFKVYSRLKLYYSILDKIYQ